MTGIECRHRWLMAVYGVGAAVGTAMALFPSFLCRAGSAVLVIGLIHMIWRRRCALRGGMEELGRLRASLLYYAPFLVGTNLIWMGLPLSVDLAGKAWVDLLFLGGSVALLSLLYVYNNRVPNALSNVVILGTNPHSEEG